MKNKFFIILLFNILLNFIFSILTPTFAQIPVATLGPIIGSGPYGTPPTTALETGASIVGLFSMFLGLMTTLGGLLTFAMFVMGGISWISSAGDKANLEKARSQITNGIIGLVIIVASWAIIAMISGIFGLKIIESQDVFQTLFQKAQTQPIPCPITRCQPPMTLDQLNCKCKL